MSIVETKVISVPNTEGSSPIVDPQVKKYVDPDGNSWVSRSFLVKGFRISSPTLNRYLANMQSIPGFYRAAPGRNTPLKLYNEAEAENILKEHGYQRREEKERWMTNTEVARELSRNYATIRKNADKFRRDHPGWFKRVKKKNRVITKYAPQLVEELREKIGKAEVAPAGWENRNSIVSNLREKGLNVSSTSLKRLIAEYEKKFPDCVHLFLNPKNNQVVQHVRPDIVKAIVDQVVSSRVPPAGWLKGMDLKKRLQEESLEGYSAKRLVTIAARVKKDHPAWVRVYQNPGSTGITYYYSPEAIKEITEFLESRQHKPKGYWTRENIEIESTDFYIVHGSLTADLLKEKRSDLYAAICAKYPGGIVVLRTNLNRSFENPIPWTIERIEKEAKEFYEKNGSLTQKLLIVNKMSSLSWAITNRYPGSYSALRERLGIPQPYPNEISQGEARSELEKLVEVKS